MTANIFQTNSYNEETGRGLETAVALISGLVLGGLFTFFWHGLPLLALIGMWPLALAISMIGVSLVANSRREESEWGMALAGQALGVVAIALIFMASVM